MRAAAIQMNSGPDLGANLELADRLLGEAAADGCVLAVLPENFALMPEQGKDKARHAEEPGDGPIQAFLSGAAANHGLCIVGGSMPLVSPGIADDRVYGACPVYDNKGKLQTLYRKIHLFDVDLVEKQESYRESDSMYPGDEPIVVDTPVGRIGLTICYDLRFPEIYRALAFAGAELIVNIANWPARRIGHWVKLLQARAIENQCYIAGVNRVGEDPNANYVGRSMIVDPHGEIVIDAGEQENVVSAEIDFELVRSWRAEFPALKDARRGELPVDHIG